MMDALLFFIGGSAFMYTTTGALIADGEMMPPRLFWRWTLKWPALLFDRWRDDESAGWLMAMDTCHERGAKYAHRIGLYLPSGEYKKGYLAAVSRYRRRRDYRSGVDRT